MAREGEILKIFGFTVNPESFFPLDETVNMKIVRTYRDCINLIFQTNRAQLISNLSSLPFLFTTLFPPQLILINLYFPGINFINRPHTFTTFINPTWSITSYRYLHSTKKKYNNKTKDSKTTNNTDTNYEISLLHSLFICFFLVGEIMECKGNY